MTPSPAFDLFTGLGLLHLPVAFRATYSFRECPRRRKAFLCETPPEA